MASRISVFVVLAPVAFGLVAACYSSSEDPAAALSPSGARGGSGAGAGAGTTKVSNTVPGSDLSCELANFFSQHCQECHGAKPVTGAEVSLLGRADLVANAPDEPSKRVIDLVIERIEDKTAPMPPADENDPVSAEDLARLKKWRDDGMPAQSCGSTELSAPPPPADDPFDTATVCTSNKKWTQGDQGSDDMHPGRACITCHSNDIKAKFKTGFDIAGTVYPTGHEPDDCYGVGGGANVVITDANGQTYELPVNSAGNFFHAKGLFGLGAGIAMPYRAKIVKNGVERVMKDEQTDGDCNSCHTEQGTSNAAGGKKAPGRIMMP